MKGIAKIILLILVLSLTLPVLTACGETKETLFVYNWADYMDGDVTADFEEYYREKTGKSIEVIYSTFDTNETMMSKLLNGDASVDMICPSEYSIQKLLAEDMLYKFDPSTSIANYSNVDQDIVSRVDDAFGNVTVKGKTETVNMNDYFVPYMWGTLGILYNEEYVSEETLDEYGWGVMWNEQADPALEGKILMKDSIRDAYAVAVGYADKKGMLPSDLAGKSSEELINSATPEMIDVVEDLLEAQREILQGYEVDFGKEDMIRERAYVCLAWSGDALWAMEDSPEDVSLNYYIPDNVVNVWFDGWAIPKNAQNKEAAIEFINYLARPDIAMRNAMEIGYTCAISEDALLSSEGTDYDAVAVLVDNEYDVEEYFSDPRRYPDMLESRFGLMRDFGSSNVDVLSMWERIKVTDNSGDLLLIIGAFGLAFCLVIGSIVIVRRLKQKRRRIIE